MSQSTVKQAFQEIRHLGEDTNVPIIRVIRPWMVITGLSLHDALHLTHHDLFENLFSAYRKLADVIDVLDEDQLREAACRCLKNITVYGEPISDGEVSVPHKQTIVWDGTSWVYTADPKLRQRGSSSSYVEALRQVRESLGIEDSDL